MEDKVYTIIVTYNAMKWIKRCLDSLSYSNLKTFVVVVDNASTDNTLNFITENYPDIHLIQNKKNKGFGGANNQGIEYAYSKGATHFFLCNQDVYINPDTISSLVAIQNKYSLPIVSPIHMNGEFSKCDYSFFKYFICSISNNDFVSDLISGITKEYYNAFFVNAAAWIINRETIESIGGFDPVFFHYGEDSNYLNRVNYHNMSIAVVPSALIAHDRVFKGNIKAFNKYSLMSTIIYEQSRLDLNYYDRFAKILTQYVLLFINIIKSVIKLDFTQFRSLIETLFYCIKITPTIRKHRDSNKLLQSNWLDIKKLK